MIRNLLLTVTLLAAVTGLRAQSSSNMTLVGQLDYAALHGTGLADIWGYMDDTGIEYVIVGANDGTSVVSLQDPANPVEVFWEPGDNSIWRDIKTYGDYAYITCDEGNEGLLILDLSALPGGAVTTVGHYYGPAGDTWNRAHNLYIEEATGKCFIFGANRDNGGVIILDLTIDPENPVEFGKFENWYCHDGMVRGDTMYSAHISDGHFAIVDVSTDPSTNPSAVYGTQTTSTNFCHNIWVSDDGDYVYTTDELSGSFVDSYDISDPGNIQRLDKVQTNPGSGVIPHNTHFINDYVVTSWYRDGTIIHDVTYPNNMIEVGHYDASPMSGDGYNSVWGTYPWLPSGLIISSDIELGLFVFDPNYVRGCYLEGDVTEQGTGNPLNGVTVEILTTPVSELTALGGDYATGLATAGTYDVRYSKAGYFPDTAFAVTLTNGVLTIQDMVLAPMTPFSFTGSVVETGTGTGIPNAQVIIQNNDFTFAVTADGSGNFTIPAMFNGDYDVYAGQWGYYTVCLSAQSFDDISNSITLQLDAGWYDDFTFDFGWTVSGSAPTGIWEKGEPIGTTIGALQSNPELDVQTDCFDECYVTGNGGGSVGTDDVDDANTILTSPVFDVTAYTDPYVEFYRWWLNGGGGGGAADDTLAAYITDGSTTAELFRIEGVSPDMGAWVFHSYRISDYLTPGANVQLIIETSDWASGDGHIVEAGLDVFRVSEGSTASVPTITQSEEIVVYPNPSNEQITIALNAILWGDQAQVVITDLSGRTVFTQTVTGNDMITIFPDLGQGLYLLDIRNGSARSAPVKITRY